MPHDGPYSPSFGNGVPRLTKNGLGLGLVSFGWIFGPDVPPDDFWPNPDNGLFFLGFLTILRLLLMLSGDDVCRKLSAVPLFGWVFCKYGLWWGKSEVWKKRCTQRKRYSPHTNTIQATLENYVHCTTYCKDTLGLKKAISPSPCLKTESYSQYIPYKHISWKALL